MTHQDYQDLLRRVSALEAAVGKLQRAMGAIVLNAGNALADLREIADAPITCATCGLTFQNFDEAPDCANTECKMGFYVNADL